MSRGPVVVDATDGGPYYVPRGGETGHITVDGEAICGAAVDVRRSHVACTLSRAVDEGKLHPETARFFGECGRCKRVAESRDYFAVGGAE